MWDNLAEIERRYEQLTAEMSRPEVAADWGRLGDLSQRRAQLKAAADRLYEEWAKMEREEGLGCA